MEKHKDQPGLLTHLIALPLFLIVILIALIIRHRIVQMTIGIIVLLVMIGVISNAFSS